MNFIKEYLPYLPLAIAIIAAALGYMTGQRSSKINRFFQQVDINLKELCGPMYFSLKRIFEVEDEQKRELFLDSFFEKFSTLNPNLYKLGNKFIIDWFIENENLYFKFKKTRDLKDWEGFWKQLLSLQIMMENEYWENFGSLYNEYRWFQKTLSSNIFIRLWNELIHILIQASQFSVLVSVLLVYLSIWDYFVVKEFPVGTINSSIVILLSTIVTYGLLIVIGSNVYGLRSQKESLIRKLGKRYIPYLFNFFDNKHIRNNKKKNTPQMYHQRKFN